MAFDKITIRRRPNLIRRKYNRTVKTDSAPVTPEKPNFQHTIKMPVQPTGFIKGRDHDCL
ncbi:MAG: hypothetical protein C5B59_18255 [Bacteroidetes bacterium]|nr:MAG: hypothetical protein C5B59_18255 [Bacteroidota bacterium]